jgi:transposase
MGYAQKFRVHVLSIKREEGLGYWEAARRFEIGVASLMRWAKRISPKKRRNKPTKIDVKRLKQDVEENPGAFQYERAARLGVSQRTVGRGLNRLGVTYKKKSFYHPKADTLAREIFQKNKGSSEADLHKFLSQLQGKEKVRVVCIDLSSPYRRLVQRHFPRAKIVADRFHVIGLIIHHFMDLARQIAPSIKHQRGVLAALRKNKENLNQLDPARLEKLFFQFPAL